MPTPPWRIHSVFKRAEEGPVTLEHDFDTKFLIPNVKRVVKDYGIKYDPQNPVPTDESLAKDAWRAAVDLLLSTGVFCTTTSRRITFTEDEIREALWNYIDKLQIGAGRDMKEWQPRRIEDSRRPGCFFTPVGVRCSEENFTHLIMAYAQEPLADGISSPIIDKIEGALVKTYSPFEQEGAVFHAMAAREAAVRVGRPGLSAVLTGTGLSAASQIASSNPVWGARPSDLRLVSVISELKIDYDLLNKALHFQEYGGIPGCLSGPLVGAYGGVESTTIIGIASHLQGLLVNGGFYTCYFPTHIRNFANTSRELLWLISVTYQALSSNTRLITCSNGFAAAGPCTDMVLYEAGLHGAVSAVSGASVLWEIAAASNKHFERTTAMEARMACETGLAAVSTGMRRSDVNELVKKVIPKYESKLFDAPLGKTFPECYDVKSTTPTAEYVELFKKIKAEFRDLGLEYNY